MCIRDSINAGYTVDLVRISFQSNVTMYGEEQEDFGSDHYWNAVKVDGQWYLSLIHISPKRYRKRPKKFDSN